MPNYRNQKLYTTLIGSEVTEAVTTTESDFFIVSHVHNHNDLSGRLDPLAHPQYLTENNAYDFMLSFYNQQEDKTDAENVGGGIGVWLDKNGNCLRFQTLYAGDNITLTEDPVAHTITIAANTIVDGGTF